MSLSLNTIQGSTSSKTKRRRGRGNGSNRGNYSGRGIKGQKCRSGVSGLKLLGLKSLINQTPKKRGFTSLRDKNQVVSVISLNQNFKDGDEVTPVKLVELGLINSKDKPVKILGKEELKLKKLVIKGVKVSAKVASEIEKKQGKIA